MRWSMSTNRQVLVALLLWLIGHVTWADSAPAMGHSQYRLDSGDVISIRVFGEEDLSFEALRLTDAGTFSYPFLGEVRAAGRTAAELEELIVAGLKGDYLIDPKVSVSVQEYRAIFVKDRKS